MLAEHLAGGALDLRRESSAHEARGQLAVSAMDDRCHGLRPDVDPVERVPRRGPIFVRRERRHDARLNEFLVLARRNAELVAHGRDSIGRVHIREGSWHSGCPLGRRINLGRNPLNGGGPEQPTRQAEVGSTDLISNAAGVVGRNRALGGDSASLSTYPVLGISIVTS